MKENLLIKIGGSLFFKDLTVIKGVLRTLSLLKNYYNLFIVVGSGMLGENYKYLRDERICINSTDQDLFNYVDDKDIWNLIQEINLKILEFLVFSTKMDMNLVLSDCVYDNNGSSEEITMIKPVEPILSAWWNMCQKFINDSDRPNVKVINRQKADIKAILYGSMLGIKNYIMLTEVNGIYTSDPTNNRNAKLIEHLTPKELKEKEIIRGETTGLDKGFSILLDNLLPYDSKIQVLSYEAFVTDTSTNLYDPDSVIMDLKSKGTWISNQ